MSEWKNYRSKAETVQARVLDEAEQIHAADGTLTGNIGDFRIRDDGEEFFLSPDDFAELYSPVKSDVPAVLGLVFLALVSLGATFMAGYDTARSAAMRTSSTSSGTITVPQGLLLHPYQDTPLLKTADAQMHADLDWALAAWKKELGEIPVPGPRLFMASAVTGLCGYAAYACAIPPEKMIVVVDFRDADHRTILMHEIGHLLGVPHIEEDPLMNPAYTEKLERPSPYAVAIAKASFARTHRAAEPSKAPRKAPTQKGTR